MPGEEETCGKRHGQPLMRIESNRIGFLNSLNQAAVPIRKKYCSAVSAVNVEPDFVAAANFVNPRYVVDRARAGGSGGGYNAKWFLAGFQIPLVCGFDLLHIERKASFYRDSTRGFPPKAQKARRFV